MTEIILNYMRGEPPKKKKNVTLRILSQLPHLPVCWKTIKEIFCMFFCIYAICVKCFFPDKISCKLVTPDYNLGNSLNSDPKVQHLGLFQQSQLSQNSSQFAICLDKLTQGNFPSLATYFFCKDQHFPS